MDYSQFPINDKIYSGAEKKIGITIDGEDYIIKFQKHTRFGVRNNHISEYLGCKIIESMGFNVQQTFQGIYNGQEVVAIKDFVSPGQQFVAFNDVGESTIEENRDLFTYSYDDIIKILYANNKLDDPQDTVRRFWEIYLLDALLGNFDRHGGNWGFIKENNRYTLAPIFDNGSSLYPNMTDEDDMRLIIEEEEKTKERIFTFPTSQILLNGKKSSYYEIISSLSFPECNSALKEIYNLFNIKKIAMVIENTKFITSTQKNFYMHMVQRRFNLIIESSYWRLVENEGA